MNKLNIYYQNVRGLRTKTHNLFRNVSLNTYDVIVFVETWLVDSVSSDELFDGRYLVWRRDRDYARTGQVKGGGVLIAVRKDLMVSEKCDWRSSAEDLWVTISLKRSRPSVTYNVHICALYLCGENSVTSSMQNPFPGWVESFNGPNGIISGSAKGLLHVLYCSRNKKANMIPVDIAIDTLLAVAWETGVKKFRETPVFNCCAYDSVMTNNDFKNNALLGMSKYPSATALWYPFVFYTENKFLSKVAQWILQVVPLHSMHYLYTIFGIKTRPNLKTVSNLMIAMCEALSFFITQEWRFSTDNVRRLRERLAPADAAIFNLDASTIDWEDHTINLVRGVRRYLLKEKDATIERARSRMHVLHGIHRLVQCIIVLGFSWLAVHAAKIFNKIFLT